VSAIVINPKDAAQVRALLNRLGKDEAKKAMVRGINTTMTGVKTDGVKILSDHYALTASAIRESWKIRKAQFRDPSGVVSTQGTFIRLAKFGARQTKAGVSVKVLKRNPRAVIAHAFITKIKRGQSQEQVYWRKFKGPHKKPVKGRVYARLGKMYRFPVKALYGPRIQDHLSDPQVMRTLEKMAGDRLTKNMRREVEAILRGY
jgi:hypothetical protein